MAVGSWQWKRDGKMKRTTHYALRTGFTLMELLIAIGILAIGGAMAAALFPAAIKENQRANSSVLGNIINENALSTLKANLSTATPPFFPSGLLIPYTGFGAADAVYPKPYFLAPPNPIPSNPEADDPDWIKIEGSVVPKSLNGFLVLGRQLNYVSGVYTYQLVIVAYKRYAVTSSRDPLDITTSVTFRSTPGSTNFKIVSIDKTGGKVQLGSPLIHRATGRFSTITSFNNSNGEGTLNRPIYPSGITEPTDHNGYVIQDSAVEATRSPAVRLMVWSGSL